MAKRMTAEQRAADARAENVADFLKKIERAKALKVYSRSAALSADGDRSAQALYDLVSERERVVTALRSAIGRASERMAEALKLLDDGEKPFRYSTAFSGDLAGEIEQLSTKITTLDEAIGRLAWATGWYVPQALSVRERARHDLLVGLDVRPDGDGYNVVSTQNGVTFLFVDNGVGRVTLVEAESAKPIQYATVQDAWLVARALVGE